MDNEFKDKNFLQVILLSPQLKEQWENEVGEFTRENNLSKNLYSNDLRHQYAAAISARNLGADKTKFLGNANEWVNTSGGDAQDRQIDKINNEIGIRYGLANPNMPKKELLKLLLNDFHENRTLRNKLLE